MRLDEELGEPFDEIDREFYDCWLKAVVKCSNLLCCKYICRNNVFLGANGMPYCSDSCKTGAYTKKTNK